MLRCASPRAPGPGSPVMAGPLGHWLRNCSLLNPAERQKSATQRKKPEVHTWKPDRPQPAFPSAPLCLVTPRSLPPCTTYQSVELPLLTSQECPDNNSVRVVFRAHWNMCCINPSNFSCSIMPFNTTFSETSLSGFPPHKVVTCYGEPGSPPGLSHVHRLLFCSSE